MGIWVILLFKLAFLPFSFIQNDTLEIIEYGSLALFFLCLFSFSLPSVPNKRRNNPCCFVLVWIYPFRVKKGDPFPFPIIQTNN